MGDLFSLQSKENASLFATNPPFFNVSLNQCHGHYYLNVPLPCVLLPSGGQKLKLTTSHLSIRVLPQVSVQHSITDLVTYLIWKK